MELNHELGDTLPQKNRLSKDLKKLVTGEKTWSQLKRHASGLVVVRNRYRLSSRISHDLANSQSHLSVRGEIFRTSAISSSVSPPQ